MFLLVQLPLHIQPVAARLLGCQAEDVTFADNAAHGGGKSVPWADLTKQAWLDRVGLSVTGFYMTPEIKYDFTTLNGRAFYYYCYGASVSEVEIDTRTGEWWLKAADIVHDVGTSINPAMPEAAVDEMAAEVADVLLMGFTHRGVQQWKELSAAPWTFMTWKTGRSPQ